MQTNQIQQLSAEELADVIENTEIQSTVDLGTSLIHTGIHAFFGAVTVVSTCGDRHAIVRPLV